MTKTISILIVLIILGVGAYFLLSPQPVDQTNPEPYVSEESSNTSAMRAEENMVAVFEQQPGTVVAASLISLAAPGYLVIHEDNNDTPGAILGSSALLTAGESTNVRVTLSRTMQDGERLHAMLHFEKGGNTTFTAAEDTPVPSSLGGPISGWFDVSTEASGEVPISI